MDKLNGFFSSTAFMPHGHCYLWRSDILWLNVGSDVLIGLAYFTIPIILIHFVRKRQDLAFNWIFVMFAMFILMCGTTHLMDIWTVWNPNYGTQGLIKLLTAGISIATALALFPLMPKALALPSPKQLRLINQELTESLRKEKDMQEALSLLNLDLENRVTEKTEAIINESEKIKSVVDHVVDGIITINEKFQIESWNPAARKIFGYSADEVIGRNVNILMPEPYHSEHDGYVTNYLTTGKAKIIGIGREVTGRRKDGSIFPMDLGVSEFRYGTRRFFTGIVRDITERKMAEQSQAASEAANAAKTKFLTNMSHEIRTPLGAVLGFSQLLANPSLQGSERETFADAVKRNGDLLSKLINDILDLSKIESGKLEAEKKEVPVAELLNDISVMLNPRALEKGINLTVVAEGAIPNVIRTDPLRLRQILFNIIGNAIKFTETGCIEVIVKQVTADSNHKLEFIVSDTGIGMTEDQSTKLFEPFTQADVSTQRIHGGTGLGLVLAKRLARLLGGDVKLTQSVPGKGSTFTITIDAGPMQKNIFTGFANEGRLSASPVEDESKMNIKLEGIKVLLVEDGPDNQMLFSQFLQQAGAAVDVADNGRDALNKIHTGFYDVVLMDLRMPVMDGYEATAKLRHEGYKAPIIALTAHALREERQRCLEGGFNDHLTKPIDRNFLIESIARYSGRKSL